MRVDFYQLTRDPAEAVLPLIARNTLAAGERLLVVSEDGAQLKRISEALWTRLPESFLAHGRAGEPQAERQPVLLGEGLAAENGARYVAYADGVWCEGSESFDRVFLLFGEDRLKAARETWKMLKDREGAERYFWKQDGGKWVKAG